MTENVCLHWAVLWIHLRVIHCIHHCPCCCGFTECHVPVNSTARHLALKPMLLKSCGSHYFTHRTTIPPVMPKQSAVWISLMEITQGHLHLCNTHTSRKASGDASVGRGQKSLRDEEFCSDNQVMHAEQHILTVFFHTPTQTHTHMNANMMWLQQAVCYITEANP